MTSWFVSLLEGGDVVLLAVVGALAVGGLLVERVLLGVGWRPYFEIGLPLGEEMVPIPAPPEGQGRTASVRWAVSDEGGLVRFWSQPGDRSAPMALHGSITLVRGPRGVHLPVRWAPPWTPLLALMWFAALGVARGQGLMTVPIGLMLIAVLLVLYRQAAQQAARELRWAFVRGERDDREG